MVTTEGMFEVRIEDSFAAAHYLSQYNGKCENLHGHNYRVQVTVRGPRLNEGGMLLDFGILKKAVHGILEGLDHSLLNDHHFFRNGDASAERIAYYIYSELHEQLPDSRISRVEVFETDKNAAAFIPSPPEDAR